MQVNNGSMTHYGKSNFYSRLLAFFALTFAWSWICWLLAATCRPQLPTLGTVLFIVGSFGPGIAAIAVVRYTSGQGGLRRWLRRSLQWRVGWRWLALSFFSPLAVIALAAAMHIALGGVIAPSPASGHVLLAVVIFGQILLLGGPLGEEFGWRGYALPVLQERYSWRVASLILGVAWGAWHLPLFYIADTAQRHIPFGLFMPSTMALSVLFAWLFNCTRGSVLPALVLHTAINAWAVVIPVIVMPDGSNLRPYGLAVGLLVLVALGLLCSATPTLRRRSLKPNAQNSGKR
ncbi:MAG: CPBP family intramembrane metalloprotease [Phormidesmis priestleyi]|uniref:CPBP family intramembrane metalloprotease n=1 Tax=Phormidesmis priestleyi TaxID=268141 RepID=A0A2W4XHX5_9CYAN|nr:MAG: CPBP family intramembrane metalloprotease [Phormidesmis priestleyi]